MRKLRRAGQVFEYRVLVWFGEDGPWGCDVFKTTSPVSIGHEIYFKWGRGREVHLRVGAVEHSENCVELLCCYDDCFDLAGLTAFCEYMGMRKETAAEVARKVTHRD